MSHKSIFAGSSIGLRFNIGERGSFEEYRLDVLVYSRANHVVLPASTDDDSSFPVKIAKLDKHNAVLTIPGDITTPMSDSMAIIEERYTHKSSGYRQVFKTTVEIRSAIIGHRNNAIPELESGGEIVEIERNVELGTLDAWFQSLKSTGSQLPGIQLTIKGKKLYIKIECAPANFESVLGGFNIGLMRYHRVNKSNKYRKKSIAYNSGRRFTITDDRYSTYAPGAGAVGMNVLPYLGTHQIPWTANKIVPIPLTIEMLNRWIELPYSARYIFERFAYFTQNGSNLASIEQIWALSNAHECLRVPWKNLGLSAPNGGGFRYTMRFGLCLFKQNEVMSGGRKQIEVIRSAPVYFRVGVVAVGIDSPKAPAFVFKHIGNNMNWKLG